MFKVNAFSRREIAIGDTRIQVNDICAMQAMVAYMMIGLYEQPCDSSPMEFLSNPFNIERIKTRSGMIVEEMDELVEWSEKLQSALTTFHKNGRIKEDREEDWAAVENAHIKYVDALTDLLVFIFGGFAEMGLNAMFPFCEVMYSNMSKMGNDGKPIKRVTDGKVMKGPNYREPELTPFNYTESVRCAVNYAMPLALEIKKLKLLKGNATEVEAEVVADWPEFRVPPPSAPNNPNPSTGIKIP